MVFVSRYHLNRSYPCGLLDIYALVAFECFLSSSSSSFILNRIKIKKRNQFGRNSIHTYDHHTPTNTARAYTAAPEVDRTSATLSYHFTSANIGIDRDIVHLKRKWWLQIRTVRNFYSHQFPDGCVSILPSVIVAVSSLRPSISCALVYLVSTTKIKRRQPAKIYQHVVYGKKKSITSTCILYSNASNFLFWLFPHSLSDSFR